MNNQPQPQQKSRKVKPPRSRRQNPNGSRQRQSSTVGLDSAIKKAPVSQTQVLRTDKPSIKPGRAGTDIIVKHREYLRDIPGSVAFSVIAIPVNPGLNSSFPWLSSMSSLYESYVFEDLHFEFKTMAATTAIGSVMSAVDYDASDVPPVDKTQLASYEGYARSAPWADFSQRSPKDDLHKQKSYFVRSGALAANQDVKLYDVGNFFIATQGQSTTDPIGEIYVSYTVRFHTPQLNNVAVGLSKSAKINTGGTIGIIAGSNVPLVPTGLVAGGAITLTATAPFNCLLYNSGLGTAGTGTPVPSSAGSTCTVESEVSVAIPTAGTTPCYSYSAELAFLVGQTFVFSAGGGITWTSNTSKIAQFNTLVL